MFCDIFRGKKVLITGDTGFKGSWLSLWLRQLGAKVYGVSIGIPTIPSHFQLLGFTENYVIDIRDAFALNNAITQIQPELILHLAAQPLVRQSYVNPTETWNTNLCGTLNLLEACRSTQSIKSVVIVTTDKVYLNNEQLTGYSENDPLGGNDPYSASKAACEILVQSYRQSFLLEQGILVATARAGNVIGGGDWSADRLIPDIIRASISERKLAIRNPHSIRPWQHVLDSLSGYLCLASRLLQGEERCTGAWNFGPSDKNAFSVKQVLTEMQLYWPELSWLVEIDNNLKETNTLLLNSKYAESQLDWTQVWDFQQTAHQTALWYKSYYHNGDILSEHQLDYYQQCAKEKGILWAQN